MGNVPLVFDTTTGQWESVSPRIWDHLLRGYGGTIGGYLMGASTYLINRVTDEPPGPAQSLVEMAGARRFLRTPDNTSLRQVSEFYDLLHAAQETHRGVERLRALGQHDEADALAERNRDLLDQRRTLESRNRRLTQMRREEQTIRNDRTISPEQKRDALQMLREDRLRVVEDIDQRRRETLH